MATYLAEVTIIALCALYLVGMTGIDSTSLNLEGKTRLLALVGLCAALGLLFLGLTSPYYGVVALFTVPAPVMFVILIIRPALVWKKPKLRIYLNLCVSASGIVWVFQILWQLVKYK